MDEGLFLFRNDQILFADTTGKFQTVLFVQFIHIHEQLDTKTQETQVPNK